MFDKNKHYYYVSSHYLHGLLNNFFRQRTEMLSFSLVYCFKHNSIWDILKKIHNVHDYVLYIINFLDVGYVVYVGILIYQC